jgi:hypothetical protein
VHAAEHEEASARHDVLRELTVVGAELVLGARPGMNSKIAATTTAKKAT